jgi:ribonuclease P protein component
MLKKTHRLRKDQDIEGALKSKKGVFDAVCGVKYTKNTLGVTRVSVVTGTKVSKNAVDRNWVRRQYQEIMKSLLPRIEPGYDLVLLTSKGAMDLDYQEKERRLTGVLQKSGLLKS